MTATPSNHARESAPARETHPNFVVVGVGILSLVLMGVAFFGPWWVSSTESPSSFRFEYGISGLCGHYGPEASFCLTYSGFTGVGNVSALERLFFNTATFVLVSSIATSMGLVIGLIPRAQNRLLWISVGLLTVGGVGLLTAAAYVMVALPSAIRSLGAAFVMGFAGSSSTGASVIRYGPATSWWACLLGGIVLFVPLASRLYTRRIQESHPVFADQTDDEQP